MDAPDNLFLEHTPWAAIFWTSYAAFFFIAARVNGSEHNKVRGQDRDRGSRALIYLMSMVGAALAVAGPYLIPGAHIAGFHAYLFILAMTLFWAGALLYVWAVRTLGAFFRTSVQLLEGQRLVTSGPYRLLRHPAYTGGILVFAGIGLAMGNWFSLFAATLSVALAYAWRIHVEERALEERFGVEFEAHRRRTWAVIPFLW